MMYKEVKIARKSLVKRFTCLGENTEKYITFTVPIEKEVTRIINNEEELQKIYLKY